jgi:CBS domain containing-hemolysin-like protein
MDLLYILLALGLVALNAFFVATEFAIVKVRETRIEELVDRGVRRAIAAREVLRNLDAYLSATQLGITFASLGLGWVGEHAFARLVAPLVSWMDGGSQIAAHSIAFTLSFLLLTFLHVVFGELAPKTLAIERPETTALVVSRPIQIFRFLFHPLIWTLNGSANLAIRLMGLPPQSEESLAHSEEELRMILAVSHRSGVLSETHARLLENALDFADRNVRQIMVPRGDIVFLDANRSYADNIAVAREGGHTRYPLCDGDLDRVIGVIHIKDLFLSPPVGGGEAELRAIARQPLFLPESLQIERLLAMFQKQHVHLGMVIDEYGGTSGVVTLEDVLEELTGEIQDEFDEETPKIQTLPDGRLLVDAGLSRDELEKLGIEEETDDEVDTLGGLVLARLGRIARVGDTVALGGRRVEVNRVRGRRILRLIVHPAVREEASPRGA